MWLKKKYGTIEEVNRSFDTAFWGHTFYDWDEIVLPNLLSEHFMDDVTERERTMFQGISLDYMRFNSDSILACASDISSLKQKSTFGFMIKLLLFISLSFPQESAV